MSVSTSTTQETSTGWAPVPDVDKLTILKLLADGRSPAFAATATNYPTSRVRQLATAHGFPDLDKVAWAVDVVAADINRAELERVTDPSTAPQRGTAQRPPAPPTANPAPGAPAASLAPVPEHAAAAKDTAASEPPEHPQDDDVAGPAADSAAGLIARGSKSARARTKRLATKAAEVLGALQSALQAEEAERLAAAEAARAKAREQAERAAKERKIRAELEELERRRDELRGQLHPARPSRPAPAPRAIDPKAVRRWARANGVEVPNAGRVPVRVVEQYLAASTKAA
ncbi:Lsr2 family DNA-binding protein [Cellulomonas marina]|uniref:Lsr2 protein n=1 Tax=Cellulomonas marina TaxID=988821 RepID=A0A1I1AUM8_9CELL|nr:Lsr2 family protein [Cellulomonas marina]GIG29301.1 hypothetical protein Cma02nite_19010 [Cellulomonas marina]SFB40040.1 Lsr2 protein [Cellulomonas marina]